MTPIRVESDGTVREASVDELMEAGVRLFTRRMVDAMFDGLQREDGGWAATPQSRRPNESQREELADSLTREILPGLYTDLDERWNYAMHASQHSLPPVLRRLYPERAREFMELAEQRHGITANGQTEGGA